MNTDRQALSDVQTQLEYLDTAVERLLAASDVEVETETETEGADEPEVLEAGTEAAQTADQTTHNADAVAGSLDAPVVVAKAAQNPRTGRRPVATRTA